MRDDYAKNDKEEENNLKHALEISCQEIEKERKYLQQRTQQLEQARAKTRISRLENPYDIYHKMKKPTNKTTNKMGVPRLTGHSSYLGSTAETPRGTGSRSRPTGRTLHREYTHDRNRRSPLRSVRNLTRRDRSPPDDDDNDDDHDNDGGDGNDDDGGDDDDQDESEEDWDDPPEDIHIRQNPLAMYYTGLAKGVLTHRQDARPI